MTELLIMLAVLALALAYIIGYIMGAMTCRFED